MNSVWDSVNIGNFPVPVLAILLFCIVCIIASGKPAETFGRLAACMVSYFLAIYYVGEEIISGSDEMMRVCIEGIPFLNYLMSKNQRTILNLFFSDFTLFAKDFLKLFIFSLIVDTCFTVLHALVEFGKSIRFHGIEYILPWFFRYIISALAAFLYIVLYLFVLCRMPDIVWLVISILVVSVTALMLFTPVIEFILLWADLIPNKFIKSLSAFIKEHKMGGVLQVAFFAAFAFVSVMICFQEAYPNLLSGIL